MARLQSHPLYTHLLDVGRNEQPSSKSRVFDVLSLLILLSAVARLARHAQRTVQSETKQSKLRSGFLLQGKMIEGRDAKGRKMGTYSNVGSVKIGNGHWNAFPWYEWMTAGAPLPMMITTLPPQNPSVRKVSLQGRCKRRERKGGGRGTDV